MDGTRYFHSANRFNINANLLSGNAFPLDVEHDGPSFVSLLWIILVWFTKVTFLATVLTGSLYFANLTAEELFKKSGSMGVLIIEMLIPTAYLNIRRKDFRKLIHMYNGALIDSDDLRRCVYDTVEPYRKGLQYYMVTCISGWSVFAMAPILKTIDCDEFTYANFTIPAYYPGEPFSRNIFIVYIILQVIGGCTIHAGKISADLYIIHYIAVLSAQYKYVGKQLCEALRANDGETDELSIVVALHHCIRHHCAVIKIGRRLAELLAFHVGATYIACILKFCFLAFGVIKLESASIEKAAYVVYVFASIVQVFQLCSSIEELLSESTSVTEDAFHENWHARSIVVKKIFSTIEVTNQMECRLSAYRIVDLVVPTLASAAYVQTLADRVKSFLNKKGMNRSGSENYGTKHAPVSRAISKEIYIDTNKRTAGLADNSKTFVKYYN